MTKYPKTREEGGNKGEKRKGKKIIIINKKIREVGEKAGKKDGNIM